MFIDRKSDQRYRHKLIPRINRDLVADYCVDFTVLTSPPKYSHERPDPHSSRRLGSITVGLLTDRQKIIDYIIVAGEDSESLGKLLLRNESTLKGKVVRYSRYDRDFLTICEKTGSTPQVLKWTKEKPFRFGTWRQFAYLRKFFYRNWPKIKGLNNDQLMAFTEAYIKVEKDKDARPLLQLIESGALPHE